MKYISRLTALLLALMMIVSNASALTVYDLTQGTMDALYQTAAEDAYVYQEAGVLGEWIELNPFVADTDMESCTFQWYDESGNPQAATEAPQILRVIYTQEEQRYYCVATDADNNSYKSDIYVIPAAQMTDMEAYVGYMAANTLDGDTGLYDTQMVYDLLMNTWNVPVGTTTLAANVVAEWWTNWSQSDLFYDMICSCVVSGAVESDDCVLYPGSSQHAEGCEWAGDVIVPEIPQPELYYGNPQGKQYTASASYTLPLDGERAVILPLDGERAVILPESGRAMINANAADGAQWQVSDGSQWIDITGENSASLTITTAKLNTIFELTGVAELRYFNKDSETVLASVSVTSEEIANGEYADPASEKLALFAVKRAETDKHTIVINYLFSGSGEIVTSPYTATIEKGGNFNADVPNPTVRGYKLAETNKDNVPQGFNYAADKVTINVKDIQADMTLDVYYEPTQVSYTVIHYKQNIGDDNYVEAARETMTGLTKSQVPEVALDSEHRTAANNTGFDPTGFYSLLYEKAAIAADGSTVVEVYYDREYYLLSFDLGGGYGVEPIYARFETPVGVVPDPVRAGYKFEDWSLDGKNVELPQTVPAQNQQYKAIWQAEETSYTVVYWRADLDDGNAETPTTYSYWGQKNVGSDSGTELTPTAVGTTHTAELAGLDEAGYFAYDAATTAAKNNNDQMIIVEGDGSTVVNVYYSRKEYTIWFIYTREKGGTYYFPNSTGCGTYNNSNHNYAASSEHASIYWNKYDTTEVPVVKTAFANKIHYFDEGGYRYYYIYLTAEYGASFDQTSWPADPLSHTDGYDFGSWAAQCGSPYRITYGKEHSNIVGIYPNMSKELIVNPAEPIAQKMVAWWAGSWDNVDDHRYHIYFQALPGQEGDEKFENKQYVFNNTSVFTCAHNGNTRVDPFVFAGFTCVNEDKDKQKNSKNYDNTKDNKDCIRDGEEDYHRYCQVFYYDRNTYTLSFFNHNKDTAAPASKTLMFGESFSKYEAGEPAYPAGLEHGAYEFAGWYTTPECYDGTEVNWNSTMPASNLTVYAKWQPVTHDVHFYLDKDDMENNRELEDGALTQTVFHGTILTEDQVPGSGANGGLTFIGWFYEEDRVEKAIDFESMPITQDLKVYGKWSSNILKEYTVYFKIKNTDTEIADPITGSTLAGMTKTFDAKGGEELKPEYREGYFPEVKSHSLTLSIDDADNTGANTFTFWYVPKAAVPYTVHYVAKELSEDANPNDYTTLEINGTTYYKLIDSVTDQNNKKAVVTETFKVIEGYMPDAYQKRLVVSGENGAANEIIFYYTVDIVNAYYKVSHWLEPLTGDNWIEYGTGTQAQGKINITQLKAEDFDLALDGYTFDVARTECIYGGVETSKKVVGNGSVTLPQEGLELKLYYVRNEYPYEIRHVELNTGVMLEQTETGKAKYGDTKSGAPKTIPGYTYKQVNPQEGQISIRVEKSDTVKLNIISYYYVENDVEIKYVGVAPNGTTFDVCGTLSADAETVKVMSGTALGSTAAAKLPAFEFAGWYDKDDKLLSTEARYVPGKTAKISVYDAATGKYVEKDAYASATYYARFAWNYADLTITKKVVEEVGFKAPEGTEFAFTVKLTGVLPSNTISVSIAGANATPMTLQDNMLTFSLTDGQTAILQNLPVGTQYSVEEAVPDNFSVEYDGKEKGAIPENGVSTTVTNHYPLRYGELKVTKSGLKNNESAIVDVEITTNNVPTTYTLVLNKDNPSATITKIQVGSTYTVTERTGWTWLYSDEPTYDKADGTIGDEPTTCTITNHSYSDQWMHDESYLVNNFGTGSNAGVNE